MKNFKFKVYLFYIVCAVIIGYPFFTIKYFEVNAVWKIIGKYFLAPIIVALIIFGPKFYRKNIKPLDPKTKPDKKRVEIFTIVFMIICATALFSSIVFSLIITTNKFIGNSEIVIIKEPVEKYYTDLTKNGRLRHYIKIENPRTKEMVNLEVYQRYDTGEIFEKEMRYGSWGILYSTE